jgi:hypothetical protein
VLPGFREKRSARPVQIEFQVENSESNHGATPSWGRRGPWPIKNSSQ